MIYFLAEFGEEPLVPREGEIRRILLLPLEKALSYFEHAGTRAALRAAAAFLKDR